MKPSANELTLFDAAPDRRALAAREHPAQFSAPVLDAIAPVIAGWRLPVHDPFAGPGERLGRLCDRLELPFTGTEIEREFIVDQRVEHGDSTEARTYPTHRHAVVTSPVYPSGMCDHFEARDGSRRHTYRQGLAAILGHDRPLHEANMGRWGNRHRRGVASERRHFDIARRCVRWWPGRVLVDVKDVVASTYRVDVVGAWRELLREAGYEIVEEVEVATPGQRHGANRDHRADHEVLLVAERTAEAES